jgi:succinylglutamate desuccinylase/aspartoacylase family protein
MKVALLAGTHGDESFPVELSKSLVREPITNVAPIIANYSAVVAGERYKDQNMAKSYPGNPYSALYEEQRAAVLVDTLKRGRFDLIIDLHESIYSEDEFLGIAGEYDSFEDTLEVYTSEQAVAISSLLNLKKIVLFPRPINIQSQLDNVVTVEVSKLNTSGFCDVGHWRRTLDLVANYVDPDCSLKQFWDTSDLELYAYRGGDSQEEKREYGLADVYRPFELVNAPGIGPNVCTIGWDSRYKNSGEFLVRLSRRHARSLVNNPRLEPITTFWQLYGG